MLNHLQSITVHEGEQNPQTINQLPLLHSINWPNFHRLLKKQRRRSYIHVQNRYSAAKPTPIAVKWSETVRGGGTHHCWCTRIQHELLFEPSPSQPLHEQQIEAEGRAKQSIRSERNQTLPFFPFPFQRRREEITCRYLFILVISLLPSSSRGRTAEKAHDKRRTDGRDKLT